MVTGIGILKAVHVFCTTLGLGGLAVISVWLAQMAGKVRGPALTAAAQASFNVQRILGPLLGLGILLGFGLAHAEGAGFVAPWLLITYILVIIGMATQFFIAMPWIVAAMRAPDEAAQAALNNNRPAIAAWTFIVVLALIVFVMVVKPG